MSSRLKTALCISTFLSIFLSIISANPCESGNYKDLKKLAPKDDPLIERAYIVFDRLKSVADKNGQRLPSLMVVDVGGSPETFADGTVLLPFFALKECYKKGVSAGDSRLAFILGHELAHLARDHFWGRETYHAFETYLKGKNPRGILAILEVTEDLDIKEEAEVLKTIKDKEKRRRAEEGLIANAKKVRKKKELQADSYGVLYMLLAGYSPDYIVSRDAVNFIKEFDGVLGVKYEIYPDPSTRIQAMEMRLNRIINSVELFTTGVRLYQLKEYRAAISAFEEFLREFPSREVYNNIGASYLQLAFEEHSRCDRGDKYFRFRISAGIDAISPAGELRYAGTRGGSDKCDENIRLSKEYAEKAIKNFSRAVELDPTYNIAKENYMAALLWAEKYSAAKSYADQILETDAKNVAALNNKAVAMYLDGRRENIQTAEKAIQKLNEALHITPSFPDALYNLARVYLENGREKEAMDTWARFLETEKSGDYAEHVEAEQLKTGKDKKKKKEGAPDKSFPEPPGVKPGDLITVGKKEVSNRFSTEINGLIKEMVVVKKEGYKIVATASIEYFNKWVVKYVEKDIPGESADEWLARYGEPDRTVKQINAKVYLYENGFGFEEMGGKVGKAFWF